MENIYINTDELGKYLKGKYFNDKDIITIERLICLLEQLDDQITEINAELEDFKEYVEENYKKITPKEMYGISDRDFYEE